MSKRGPALRAGLLRAAGALALLGLLGGTHMPAALHPSRESQLTQERAAQAKNAENSRTAPVLLEDKGKFRILLDGQTVGTEEFNIAPNGKEWVGRGTTEIRAPGGPAAQVSARLTLLPDGTPLRYEWSTQGQKKAAAAVEFQGETAKMTLRIEGAQPFVQELSFGSPRIVILDNNVYHHYALLARLYDWSAKGAQTFPVLIPQDMTPGSITVEAIGQQTIEGSPFELLRARTPDLELNLYLDASHRLVRLTVPASKAEVRRE